MVDINRHDLVPQRLVAALTGALDVALEGAIAGLAEEICEHAGSGLDRAQVAQVCAEALHGLRKKAAPRHERFSKLTVEYILRVPTDTFGNPLEVKPADLIDPLKTLEEAEFLCEGPTGPDAPGLSDVSREEEQRLDRDLSKASEDLASAVQTARGLQAAVGQLTEQLRVGRAAVAAVDGKAAQVVGELQEVMSKMTWLCEEEQTLASADELSVSARERGPRPEGPAARGLRHGALPASPKRFRGPR